ncbi:MAG: sensor histidine kinase, partial [Pusillimonas sp.]
RWAAPEQMPDSPATGSGSPPTTTPLNLAPRIQELLLSSTQVDSYPLAVIVGLSRDDLLAPYFLRQRVLIGAALILTLLALAGESRHARLAQHAKESDYQLSRALRQVLAREQRLADLFRAIPDPAIAFSRISHRATGFNPPMQRLTRCSANALDGADLATFAAGVFASDVSPDRNDRIQALTRKLDSTLENSAENRPARFEIHIDTPAPVIYEVRLEPMTDEPAGLLVLLRDITAQHRLERMTNDFAATAAHEMRTPLASILGFSELLAAGLISEHERGKIAGQIYQRAKNMSELVNDLLTLTRLETGNGGGQFSAFDLRTIIDPLMRQLPEAAARLTLDTPPTPMPVMGNVFELVTALRNAVENAFKYGAPEKGVTLRLWIDTDHHQARLTVSDHGPGICASDIDRVFKRFVRLNHSGNPEGSGLGLPLVRGVLQHHKGWAWVESSPGQGFTLHMALPLHYPTPRKTASTGTLSS